MLSAPRIFSASASRRQCRNSSSQCDKVSPSDAFARAETKRVLGVLDRDVELPGQEPKAPADVPATREARVERKRAVDQCYHRADIFTEERESIRGVG